MDLNGDGLTDLLIAKDDYKTAYINDGKSSWIENDKWKLPDGNFIADNEVKNSKILSAGQGRMLYDINGDGLVDLLIANNDYKTTYINNGNGWTQDDSWNIPDGNFVIQDGDSIIIIATKESVADVEDIFTN